MARKRDRKSICKEHMHELLGLGGITVSNFKKGTEKGTEKKINAIESGPCLGFHPTSTALLLYGPSLSHT